MCVAVGFEAYACVTWIGEVLGLREVVEVWEVALWIGGGVLTEWVTE